MDEGNPQLELHGKLTVQQFDLAVRELELATFPCVVRKALTATAEGLADIVCADVALATRVMAAAGGAGPNPTLRQAVRDLGEPAVRTLALSARLLPACDVELGGGSGLDYLGFWRHSIGVALASEELARRLPGGRVDPGLAYTVGLLHDVGKLALEQCMPKSYRRVLEAVRLHLNDISDFERSILGVDHGMAGRRLAARWHLGQAVEQASWLCHNLVQLAPEGLGELGPVVELIALADLLVRRCGIGFSGNATFVHKPEDLAPRVGLTAADVREVGLALEDAVRARQVLLGLDEPPCTGSAHTLRLANRELALMSGQLQRRIDELSAPAEAFARVGALVAAIADHSAMDQALARIADALAGVLDRLDEGESLVIYATAPDGRQALALRRQADAPDQYRQLELPAADLPAGSLPADAVIEFASRLLGELAGQTDWIELAGCTHRALALGGRWVGGVVYPRRCGQQPQARRTLEAMEPPLAGMIAELQARAQAARLGEELAVAAQTLAATQEHLAEERVLSAVGEMAAGAAHEMNNPLAVISGRAQLMRERAGDDEARRVWQLMADQAQRISDIISDLMEYASPPQPQKAPLDVADLLQAAGGEFSSASPAQARPPRVDITCAEDAPPVLADAAQMRAVLVELMRNAQNASPNAAAVIRLSARVDEADGNVLIAVRDEGCGMDAATLAAAFTPFFSSQRAGRRRGLGLPKAKRFVEINGGRIWIRSQAGQGTTVYVELPRARDSAVEAAKGRQNPIAGRRPGGRNDRPSVPQHAAEPPHPGGG